jgi:sugar lactone lactonase YvrE
MRKTDLAVCCVLGWAAGVCAQTQLYVAEYQFQAARFSAMGTDGSSPHVLFALPPDQWLPLGVSYNVATNRLVWIDSAGASEVRSANLDGSAPAVLATPSGFARGCSLDAQGRVYFSSNNTLRRVNADGTGLEIIFIAPSADPIGDPRVDAVNGHVYVGADGEIKRLNLDGSAVKTVVRGVSQPRAIGLDVGRGSIYWIDADTVTDFVGRARLDDTEFTVLIDNSPSVVQSSGLIDLLVDPAGGALYYADELTGTVTRAGLDGQGATVIYTSPAGKAPSGLVLSTGEPAQALQDCNGNGVGDDLDIAAGAADCDTNGVLDSCQVRPCPARTFLLDQGTSAAPSGRAVGVPSQWQVFQPFDVPAGGWTIGEIGLDGYTTNYADGTGMTVRLYPDNGTGTRPNETAALAAARIDLRFGTMHEAWVYAPLNVTLPPGRFWVRIEANNPTVFGAAVRTGFTGLPSISRGSSGSFSAPSTPVALRVVQGATCVADFTGDGTVNVQDFLAFLQAFAAGDARADVDGSGQVNVQDFLAYLQLFAAGC